MSERRVERHLQLEDPVAHLVVPVQDEGVDPVSSTV